MKLESLFSKLAALFVTATLMAGLTSGCGNKTNGTNETQGNEKDEQAATAAAQKWLAGIDEGQYAQSWQDTSPDFQNAVSQQKWESSMTTFRKPLGDLQSRNLQSAHYTAHLPGAPAGQYVVMQFATSFANQKSAIETVTFSLEAGGQWKASGYFIK
ncbi:MAG TPA: DUF4019 domain-containing protein [Verrucomicrobiae bacterium]|jgi:serine/threonine-protein kinase|nr:DUF4019 domain-containing protein [Verrucomicrobiae bacterium]